MNSSVFGRHSRPWRWSLLALLVSSALNAGAAPNGTEAGKRMRALYAFHCRGCHLEGGEGMPGRVPSLHGVGERFLRIPGGRAYLVQVPGVAQSSLEDAELAELMNWLLDTMRTEPSSDAAAPYTAAEVGELRRYRVNDIAALRRQLLGVTSPQR